MIFTVAVITFLLLQVVPGGPFDTERELPREIQKNIDRKYGLDLPLYKQLMKYLVGLAKGDLGPSFKYKDRSVNDIIKDSFQPSLQLGFFALLISVVIGIPAGAIAATKRGKAIDRGGMMISTIGISVPNFVMAAFLIWIFAHVLKILPPALWEGPEHVILPSITLGLAPTAYIARLTRSSVVEALTMDYVRTARAKGLSPYRVLVKHVMKNSLSPVINVLGPLAAMLVTGSFVVEYIFSIPGMGKFFITAVSNRDYPLIMGVTIIYTILIVIANILVDIALAAINPKMRLE